MSRWSHGRRAFTLFETVLALSIMAVVMVLTAKAGYWAMTERVRANVRLGALEAANNMLEAARATSWDALTPAWAAAQHLPKPWVEEQPDGKLQIKVEPEPSLPRVKRVTITIRWEFREGTPPREIQLVTSFAAREARQPEKGS